MVPLDGSALAERALPYAVAIARSTGGKLLLIRVVAPLRFPAEYQPSGQTKAMVEAKAYLTRISEGLGAGLAIETATYYEDPALALVNEVQRRAVDLVIMSTHGHSGVGSWIYGSITAQVFRHVNVPVLVVSPHCAGTWPTERPPRILVPLDGSKLAEDVLDPTRDIARALGAEIHLTRVIAPSTFKHVVDYPGVVGVPHGASIGDAEAYLETVAARLHEEGFAVTMQAVEAEGVAPSLAEVAEESGSDMIAMSTHGRSGVARLVMGSVASGAILKATVPIMLVRPVTMHHLRPEPQETRSVPTAH
jgi:nucleotide-binding universal stress UspA family protein